jgi:hypothetical protein
VYWRPLEYEAGVLSYFVGYIRMLSVSRLWKASVRIAGVPAEICTEHKFSCVIFRPTCSVGGLTTHWVFCATSIRCLSHSNNKEQFRCHVKKKPHLYVLYECTHTRTCARAHAHAHTHTGQNTYFGLYKIILKSLWYQYFNPVFLTGALSNPLNIYIFLYIIYFYCNICGWNATYN